MANNKNTIEVDTHGVDEVTVQIAIPAADNNPNLANASQNQADPILESIKYPIPLPNELQQYTLAEGAGDVWFNPRKRKIDHVITSGTVETEEHKHNSDNTYIVAVMLKVKMGEKPLKFYSSNAQKGMSTASHQNKIYDRFFTFADVKTPGRCFALVCPSKTNTSLFLERGIKFGFGVGTAFLLKEVYHTTNKLGGIHSMTLMEGFSGGAIPLQDGVRYVPRQPLVLPKQPDATHYFCYHNVTSIKFNAVGLKICGCSGRLCDRQIEPGNPKTWQCGCIHKDHKVPGWVLNMNATIPCETEMDLTGKTLVTNFRSYKTTCVFIDPSTLKFIRTETLHKKEDKIRDSTKAMIQYVNQNGGWTILGWIKCGEKRDDSDQKDVENFANIDGTPHITYLMPSHLEILNNLRFKEHQYRFAEVSPPPSEEEKENDDDE